MASAFGGGSSQTAFGARGGATVLSKATTVCAVLFMLGALALAIIGQRGPGLGHERAGAPPAGAGATRRRRRLRRRRQQPAHRRRAAPAPASAGTQLGTEHAATGAADSRLSLVAEVAELADAPA